MTNITLSPEQCRHLLLFIENTIFTFQTQINLSETFNQLLDVQPLKNTEVEMKKLQKELEAFFKENRLSKIVIENKK